MLYRLFLMEYNAKGSPRGELSPQVTEGWPSGHEFAVRPPLTAYRRSSPQRGATGRRGRHPLQKAPLEGNLLVYLFPNTPFW